MKRLIALFILTSSIAACAGGENARQNSERQTANAEKNAAPKPAEAVQFSVAETEIKAGETGEVAVKLKIKPPFHVNANPPSESNLIPTSIEFEAKNGLTFGKPIYPAGKTKKFAFSEKPLQVYEGEVEIKLPIKADKTAAGEQKAIGKLRFQPCDDEVCYRPQTIDVALPIRIS